MNLTSIIIVNAVLDLAAVVAILAVVRFTHRLHRHASPQTSPLAQPIPIRLALPADEAEELAEAA